jgi:tetratricopeptide (TPR) repeat protein
MRESLPKRESEPKPVFVFAVLAAVLALRILHLSSALKSPLSYQPGPDEDYYLRFGEAVAAGVGADAPEFTFMDPGYGYLLGGLFKLLGVNLFAVYLLQALLDTATAYGILTIGRMLELPRAGLLGALLYAVNATAIMFCATLLKETAVAAYLCWWVAGALAVYRSPSKLASLAFGAYCGVGVALRSTLSVLVLVALLVPALAGAARGGAVRGGAVRSTAGLAALFTAGLVLALAPWSLRNHRAFGSFSPLPHNGGIVLHQAYNVDNPQSAIWIPAFVNYSNPSEIWRGYAAQAQALAGRPLSPPEVDRYWRDQALGFMSEHPGAVAGEMAHKSLMFLADTEVPNNRSAVEERMFSPVLQLLPAPAIWLLSMGLAGLIWLARRDRRWVIVAAPIALSWATMTFFWAEDRFRFHCMPELALCSGLIIDELMRHAGRYWQRRRPGTPEEGTPDAGGMAAGVLGASGFAVAVAAVSLCLGSLFPPPPVRWDHIVWGYIKMGQLDQARSLAERIATLQPDNGPIMEARGYLAAADRNYADAVRSFSRAIALRPRSYLAHYNLAKAFLALGDKTQAAEEAKTCLDLNPSADARTLLAQIEATP